MTDHPGLTLYDTGERLEPRPWPLTERDHYGLVDFDDDEMSTVFTVVGKRPDGGSPSYLLSISTCTGTPTIELDGDRVLVLDEAALAGLDSLAALAQRGREDFQHQAATTRDYTAEDIAAADAAWSLALRTITSIRGEQP